MYIAILYHVFFPNNQFTVWAGIYNVGRAAEHPPALVVLSHKPEGATKNIAWVGKGIVFDTGGLCIKARVRATDQ